MRKVSLILIMAICSFAAFAQNTDNSDYNEVKKLVESMDFIFEASSMLPREGSSRSLVTNLNYIKVKDGYSEAMLPYFGNYRLTSGGGMISFKDSLEKLRFSENKRKSLITLTYQVRNDQERFNVQLSVGSSGWATVVIKSINRPSISYYGKLKAINKNEDIAKKGND
jgi:hypothetical protein